MKKFLTISLILTLLIICIPLNVIAETDTNAGISNNVLTSDVDLSDDIHKILEKMTTEQKIAQMIMPAFRQYNGTKVTTITDKMQDILNKYSFAGVILFAENNSSTEQAVKLIDSLQKANATVAGRPQLLIAVDQEGAGVSRLSHGTQGPGNMGLGATNDPEKAKEMANIIGEELYKIGYNVNFAPVVDVNNNPSNPIINIRSFSDDAKTVSKYGINFMQGLNEKNIISSLKHFPGHGDTSTDSHTGLPKILKTYEELKENELIPFIDCINSGAELIMTAHIQFPNITDETYISKKDSEPITLPATLSHKIITEILRGDLNYNGVVVTDAMEMGAISQHFDILDTAKLAINAGCDILLMPTDPYSESGIDDLEQYIEDISNLVASGDIDIETIDNAVIRILTLKENHDLLDEYSLENLDDKINEAQGFVGSKENHDKEFEIAKQSITLVKNNGMLPIKDNEKTVIAVAYSNELLSAEYAVKLLKENGIIDEDMEIDIFLMRGKSLDEIKEEIGEAKNVIVISEQGSVSALANSTYATYDDVIEYVHSYDGMITFISCQQPYDVARLQAADSILIAWSCKGMYTLPDFNNGPVPTYGVSIPAGIYMAFGENTKLSGKLPVNIPVLNESYKYTDEILYERGYGLQYKNEEEYLKLEDFNKIAELVSGDKYGSDSGSKYDLFYDVTYAKGKTTINIAEENELTSKAYNSILSAIEVIYGEKGVDYFTANYHSFEEEVYQSDEFSVTFDIDMQIDNPENYKTVSVEIDDEYIKDVVLRTTYIGETVNYKEKTLKIDFSNNTYSFGIFDSVEDLGDIGFLVRYILNNLFENNEGVSGDSEYVAYFNIVDNKIVIGDEKNSIFKITINTQNYQIEISATNPNVTKRVVNAVAENVDSYEFEKCSFGNSHSHYRIAKFEKVNIEITYGKTSSSSGGGGSSTSSYKITTKVENGTITPNVASVKKNKEQEFTFKADEGYEIIDVIIDGKSVGAVSTYKFENVTEKHTIELKTAKVNALVNIDKWASGEMARAIEAGIIPETFKNKDAKKPISRSEFVAVAVKLYEALKGSKAEIAKENPFTDTDDEYVLKAYNLGITMGVTKTKFGDTAITREQMITMIVRAVEKVGLKININLETLTPFDDDNQLHTWARVPVYFMVSKEIVKGVGNNRFNPLGEAKIEEAIALALRILEAYKK